MRDVAQSRPLEIEVFERFVQAAQGVLGERDVVVGQLERGQTQRGKSVIRHLADSIARQVEQRQVGQRPQGLDRNTGQHVVLQVEIFERILLALESGRTDAADIAAGQLDVVDADVFECSITKFQDGAVVHVEQIDGLAAGVLFERIQQDAEVDCSALQRQFLRQIVRAGTGTLQAGDIPVPRALG